VKTIEEVVFDAGDIMHYYLEASIPTEEWEWMTVD
jgi:hypothetical protein